MAGWSLVGRSGRGSLACASLPVASAIPQGAPVMDTTQAQPTAPVPSDPAYPRRATQAACPVCDRPGWVIDLPDGGTVTLHSAQSTAVGRPIIDDACWTRE